MEWDLSKIASKALDNALDNVLYEGKSIREWIVFIAESADDLVSKENVLKNIEWAEYEHDPYYGIVDCIKELPSACLEQKQIPNKWIKCNDRMPEEYKEVLFVKKTWGKNREFKIGIFNSKMKWWQAGSGVIINEDVTHWMPLPELPEEEEEWQNNKKCKSDIYDNSKLLKG